MPSRVRRLLLAASLLGLLAGCAHRPSSPTEAASADTRIEQPPGVARVTAPGTAFTRAAAAAPFDPRLVVTNQTAHQDLFVHSVESMPRYHSADRLYRGQRIHCLPFARNYGVAPDGRTDLTYEFTIQKPGTATNDPPISSPLWQETVPGPDRELYPATTVIFEAEPRDPAGDYVVVARVTDHLAGQTVELRHPIRLVDYTPPAAPVDFDSRRWFDGYHLAPTPELALPALSRLFDGIPADQRVTALPSLLGFYDQVLTDNPWLLPAFCTRLARSGPDEAYALSVVLGHHLRHVSEPPAGLDFATWVRLEDFRTHAWPEDLDAPLVRAAQLDALWGRFFASGLYAPLETILTLLDHHADLGAADQWQKDRAALGAVADLSPAALAEPENTPDSPPADVRRDVLLRTALWSLRDNARRHPLLRSYLDWTLRLGALPETEKNLLVRVLETDASTAAVRAAPQPTVP